MLYNRNMNVFIQLVLRIRPQFEENRGSRLITYTQASERSLSTWVGDDQGIATVECTLFLAISSSSYQARAGWLGFESAAVLHSNRDTWLLCLTARCSFSSAPGGGCFKRLVVSGVLEISVLVDKLLLSSLHEQPLFASMVASRCRFCYNSHSAFAFLELGRRPSSRLFDPATKCPLSALTSTLKQKRVR